MHLMTVVPECLNYLLNFKLTRKRKKNHTQFRATYLNCLRSNLEFDVNAICFHDGVIQQTAALIWLSSEWLREKLVHCD